MPDSIGRIYIASFTLVTLAALVVAARARPRLVLFERRYVRWPCRPWKLASFAIALTGMVIVAPLSGDPTWDYVTGSVQSVLAFVTAPWAVGTIYRSLRGLGVRSRAELTVAGITWMVSVSWFYDAYLYLRDGRYGPLWLENLWASSGLYFLAGVFWSLRPATTARPGLLGARLAFADDDWPAEEGSHKRVAIVAFVVMGFTTLLMSPFLVHAWERWRGP